MANILFIDDEDDLGGFTKRQLEAAQHTVTWIQSDYWSLSAKMFEDLAADESKKWDILILDLNYSTDEWGGFWFFNQCKSKGLRPRWSEKEIIYTKKMGNVSDLKDATSGNALSIRIFMDTAGIPFENAFRNDDFDRATLLAKIQELTGS